MRRHVFLTTLLAVLWASTSFGQVTYVDLDAVGGQNGSSWQDAYTDLQDALANTSSGEIWVAEGTYTPAPVGQPTISFQLKNNVALYGGFDGTETFLSQRDVAAHETFLSGDLAGDDTYGAFSNWWQYNWTGQADNCGRIVDGSGVGSSAVLDGFSIVAGYGVNMTGFNEGAGLFINQGSPTVANCTFRYNSYGRGASIFIDGGTPTFDGCIIKDAYNFSRTASGVYVDNATVSFTDCDFINHYTVTNFGGNDGSAYCGWFGADTTFLRCEFVDNQIGNWFAMGDSSGSYGAGIFNMGDVTVDSCDFSGGFGNGGSAICTYGGLVVRNSRFFDNFARPYPINSFIDDGDVGAAICVFGNLPAGRVRSIDSCTFVENYCDKGAGIYVSGDDPVPVRNCILYYNRGPIDLPGEDSVPILKRQFSGSVALQDCCVEELWQKIPNEDPTESTSYPGSFDQDPMFVAWTTGDLNLLPASPCRNSGATNALPPGLTVDLHGNPRVSGSEVDMGCYEATDAAMPSLTATSLITEVQGKFRVFNAQPGETVYLAYSFAGLGVGPSIPQLGGLNLDLVAPVTLFQVLQANASGHATASFVVPPTAPLVDVDLQAAIARGTGGVNSVLTNTVSQHIYLKP